MAGEWIERGAGPWRERALALQLRIRDRFRVAVDRRRRWRAESDHSMVLRRWALRVRSFWKDPSSLTSLSSPSYSSSTKFRFYRKKVDKDVDAVDDSAIVRLLQALAVPVIANACHIFMHGFNYVQVYGAEKLHQALLERPKGKPLVTVSNHVAAIDDPFVIASLLPPSAMMDSRNLRWALCASDRCFTNPIMSAFFRSVKVLPVSRGEGIYQKGMDMALSKLNDGGWVHIFPEGSRSRDGGKTIGPAKRGVGRLVMDADSIPMVIPFVHTGMQDVMPIGTHLPKTGKRVIVVIGDPINFEDLLLDKDDISRTSRGALYDVVTSKINQRLQELKAEVDILALQQPSESENHNAHSKEYGYALWQQVDWEAFGIASSMSTEGSSQLVQGVNQPPLPVPGLAHVPEQNASRTVRRVFSDNSGFVSRVRGYINPGEFMGFAARGLFMNGRFQEESHQKVKEVRPLNAWKQFLEENILLGWNNV